jgi:resuscitation-promoting factor RpfB
MPTPSSIRAVRASVRALPRRPPHLLALAAVALPLVALAPALAGVPDDASAPDPIVESVVEAGAIRLVPVASETAIPQVVTVIDGLTIHLGVSDASTVVEALRALGVERSPLDRVEPELLAPIDGPMLIRIARVEVVEQQVEVELPRQIVRVEDPRMLRGYARVDRAGRVGTRVDTKLVLTVDGEVESRLTLQQETKRAPVDRVERVGTRMLDGETIWDALARCEAGGRWEAVRVVNSRVSYHGGLQFDARTWSAYRPDGFPSLASEASREQQIEVAERVLARQGWGAWPACARRLGLR